MTALDVDDVDLHLAKLADNGYLMFRENRGLWQLTADGRVAHVEHLAADLDGIDVRRELKPEYPEFVEINVSFKDLCGDWQLRDGEVNDHTDADYDAAVIDRLGELHDRAVPVVSQMGAALDRLDPYPGRLDAALDRVRVGEANMFTGVMCRSYHDVWMELHEDLILTQGIDREDEQSF